MRTDFSEASLARPAFAASEQQIRKCTHCGFCNATCPTYVLLGDELDSPRGRIYLMKDMLEQERAPTPEIVKHVDRCLSCLACMTTCPSSVNYMHLVDHARAYINDRYRRPLAERFWRGLLAIVLPHPRRMRLALALAQWGRWLKPLAGTGAFGRPLAAMLSLAPARTPAPAIRQTVPVSSGRPRVALLGGCAEPVLRPEIRAATLRLLERAGFAVGLSPGEGCCGALVHHMGNEADARTAARRNVDAWIREIEQGALSAIIVTASGCGTMIKNYGFLLRDEPEYADKAARVSALAKDVCELLEQAGLPPVTDIEPLTVAYLSACSLQHGQNISAAPKRLLTAAGFVVKEPDEAHLCCGSAGTYNILQPQIARALGERKAAHLAATGADVVAAGNIGCLTQIANSAGVPAVHTVELLDWATGGPRPLALDAKG